MLERRQAQDIARMAQKALLYEISATPKPGLVDRHNSGSHRDMDFFTFMASASALFPYFEEITALGGKFSPEEKGLPVLLRFARPLGVAAEREMFTATGNVNTHKGAIFSLGLFSLVSGYLLAQGEALSSESLCKAVRGMTKRLVAEDLSAVAPGMERTSGEKLYTQKGLTGVRGEASSGFFSVRSYALPALYFALDQTGDINAAALHALISLMAHTEDTNVLSRCGEAGAGYVKSRAREYLKAGSVFSDPDYKALFAMDQEFIKRNLSPGGCADLLAAALFLYFVEAENFCGKSSREKV